MALPSWLRDPALNLLPTLVRRQYLFLRAHGRLANLKDPRTFSEKVLWRMRKDHRDVLNWTCDKDRMKREVVKLDPTIRVLPTLWFGTHVRELENVLLPHEWVIKPNRQSNGRVHFAQGAPDIDELERIATKWLRNESWRISRKGEWAYGQAQSGLLVEPRLKGPEPGAAPIDYKVFVFDGRPEFVQVHYGRGREHVQYHVTPEWTDYGVRTALSVQGNLPPRPKGFSKMLEQASNVCRDFEFMRVDFYEEDGEPYFGEVTPYPAAGLRRYSPKGMDLKLGKLWKLPELP